MDYQCLLGLTVLICCLRGASSVCTQIPRCDDCSLENGSYTCNQCIDPYVQGGLKPTGCCSPGCRADSLGFRPCNMETGVCQYGCVENFVGPTCDKCSSRVTKCDACAVNAFTDLIDCSLCTTGYYVTTNLHQCCPEGCDSCDNATASICSTCKSDWFLYNDRCDTCGEHCNEPSDNTERCNRQDGRCLYGCETGWHGSSCYKECLISRCLTCDFNEPNDYLYCVDCNDGFYGDNCDPCSNTCLNPTGNVVDLCMQNGTCRHGCKPGWRGQRCETRCDNTTNLEHCDECDRYNLQCSVCKVGYWGSTCQNTCQNTCVRVSGMPLCNIADGSCSLGCQDGYWGPTCTTRCPNCASGRCNRTTGYCTTQTTSETCRPGFYDPGCMSMCPANCAPDPMFGTAFCDFTDGKCTHGCVNNTHGTFCNKTCSIHCKQEPNGLNIDPLCEQAEGACKYMCNPGSYLPACTQGCASMCVDGTCDIITGMCPDCDKPLEQQTYLCPTGNCLVGTHGRFCNNSCPGGDLCLDHKCDRQTGSCIGCVIGYHGDVCDISCSHCVDRNCSQAEGFCYEGCEPGFYGPGCEFPCHERCAACNRDDGFCERCDTATYGRRCEFNCSLFCLPDRRGDVTCSRYEGHCDEGACIPGYYNQRCNDTCSKTCAVDINNDVTCNLTSGHCDRGCKTGYFGPFCEGFCSVQCLNKHCVHHFSNCVDGCIETFYGPLCDIPCDIGCVDDVCDDVTGACSKGCGVGNFGNKCEYGCLETCVNRSCDRATGKCSECFREKPGPQCRNAECEVRKWGQLCEEDCRGGHFCKDSICDRYTGICDGCIDGHYGDTCQNSCSACVSGYCNQTSGICDIGCKNGYHGQKCDQMCHDRCEICNRDTGICEKCVAGTYGPVCESNCSLNCIPDVDDVISCSKDEGNCDTKACFVGFYSQSCAYACSEHCNQDDCDFLTGHCRHGCDIGWHEDVCDGACSDTCANKHCLDNATNCVEGCVPEYFGDQCSLLCHENCNNGVCLDDGYCSQGCEPEWYQDKCSVPCNETCTDDTCDRLTGDCVECLKDKPGPLCRTAECPVGVYGKYCVTPCPSATCQDNKCARETGYCLGCIHGYHGHYCNLTCSTCRAGTTCQQSDGLCDADCEHGYYGDYCLDECRTCVTCTQESGLCTECPVGKHGQHCEHNCSENCLPINGVITCDLTTAACESGACATGYWNRSCSSRCHQNCKNDSFGQTPCMIEDGRCTLDCVDLYFGTQCDLGCFSQCLDNKCDREDGVCAECEKPNPGPNCPDAECPPGFFGQECKRPCPTGCTSTCDRYTEKCDQCKPGFYGNKCDVTCTGDGCYQCLQDSGACTACHPGRYGPICEYACGFCTPGNDNLVRCEKTNGDCIPKECVPGNWGRTCKGKCDNRCYDDGDDINECYIDTGICKYGCDPTFYGFYCENDCSPTCNNSRCLDSEFNCYDGCSFGFYGENCNTACSDTCIGGRCDGVNGACVDGCVAGYYGATCLNACVSDCIDGKCSRELGKCPECYEGANTSRPSYYCRNNECDGNTHGTFCQQPCRDNCFSTCERYTADCDACDDGWYNDGCNATCGSCLGGACQQSDGACAECSPGYYGNTSPHCNKACLFSGCLTCDKTYGTCDECKIGYHGERCDLSCSNYCSRDPMDNLIHCDKATGNCEEGSCVVGFWSRPCNLTCNSNCLMDDTMGRPCEVDDGTCTRGCEDTWFGSLCNQRCSSNCEDQTCDRDGTCSLGCVPGLFGEFCQLVCGQTCNDGTCNMTTGTCDECDKPRDERSPLCRDADCPLGLHGLFCNETCSRACANGICTRYTAHCVACPPGYHGNDCVQTCTNCGLDSCNQQTAECDGYCLDGFYGNTCGQFCLYEGCQTCSRSTGECETCQPKLYGQTCQMECSDACLTSSDGNIYCDKDTGACAIGNCSSGYFGEKCDFRCPGNCLPSPRDQMVYCDYMDGACLDGCQDEWYGSHCTLPCSVNCAGETRSCGRDGKCSNGCVINRYGNMCNDVCTETCNDDTCDRDGGICVACLTNTTPACRDPECPGVFYGLGCNLTCNENCLNRKCKRYTSVCESCVDYKWGQQCEKSCGACVGGGCNQTSGRCPAECQDLYYGPNCDIPCRHDGCQRCAENGECTVCKQGRYGTSCERTCSQYCQEDSNDNLIYCDKNSGACDTGACKAGHYDVTCSLSCQATCGQDVNGARPCDRDTSVCLVDECELSYWGDECINGCSTNCINSDCFRNSTCRIGCQDGAWGDVCEFSCLFDNTCNDGTCNRITGTCLECGKTNPSPLCRTADCPPGKHGVFCDEDCPTNCAGGVCLRDTGLCAACKTGYYGNRCQNTCPNCEGGTCFQNDGQCEKGCTEGWYTLGCTMKCKYPGCQTCHIVTGNCIQCIPGNYGENTELDECGLKCERTCQPNNAGIITCNKLSGSCDTGRCLDGFYGSKCDKKCSDYCATDTCGVDQGNCEPCLLGYYGQRCDSECSTRCKNKNCTVQEDQCQEGCTAGRWGSRCENMCSANCMDNVCDKETGHCTFGCTGNLFWGATCLEQCNGNCIENVCNRTGYCTKECEVGFYGDKCESTCSEVARCTDGTCDRHKGDCPACFNNPPGNTCPTADCPSGKRGQFCRDNCTSTRCLYNRCERYLDTCPACPDGFWGVQCENTCPNCKDGTGCLKTNGQCVESCKNGWYGDLCNTPCNELCTACGRNQGECIECKAGRYGDQCTQICSSNCMETVLNGANMIYCAKLDGACREGACKPNYWGKACKQSCGPNCKLDGNGNRMCALLDGACANGCKDTFYGTTCTGVCSDRCENKLCRDFADKCIEGCAEGYHGPTCGNTCSKHCAGAGRCTRDTGRCLEGCELDYYGDRCESQCINSCLDGKCAADGGCDDCKTVPIGPKCRVQVCQAGWYGPTCESQCPSDYCQNDQCHRINGTCNSGCLNEFFGPFCVGRCNCDSVGTQICSQTDGECVCKNGFHGDRCQNTCSEGCISYRCDKTGQCTEGCKPGRYGATCEQTCTTCFNSDCNAVNGECKSGCVDGYYGANCQNRCPQNCQTCHVTSGVCQHCVVDYYNLPSCDEPCSRNCEAPPSGRSCRETDGSCISGCQGGFYGVKCPEKCGNCYQGSDCNDVTGACNGCSDGWWGTTCKERCGANCARIGGQLSCDQYDGSCNAGCVNGYHGATCTLTCSERCTNKRCTGENSCTDGCAPPYYGLTCQNQCSNCKLGICDRNGICDSNGCKDGYYGNGCIKTCSATCRDNTCDISTGTCADCSMSPKGAQCRDIEPAAQTQSDNVALTVGEIGGIVAGCLGLVLIFVTLLICCVFYRRKAHDMKHEIHLPSDVLERLSNHRSMHSTISTNYPVARVVGGDDEKDFVLF